MRRGGAGGGGGRGQLRSAPSPRRWISCASEEPCVVVRGQDGGGGVRGRPAGQGAGHQPGGAAAARPLHQQHRGRGQPGGALHLRAPRQRVGTSGDGPPGTPSPGERGAGRDEATPTVGRPRPSRSRAGGTGGGVRGWPPCWGVRGP